MSRGHYYICKNNENNKIIYIDYNKLKGFDFEPKKSLKYDGIVINKMVVIKPSMVEKILRRKIKIKLDLYLKLIANFLDSDDSSANGALMEALNDLTRYKNIVMYKYRKYLDDKYLNILLKKIAILEYELNTKIVYTYEDNYENNYEEEITSRRTR